MQSMLMKTERKPQSDQSKLNFLFIIILLNLLTSCSVTNVQKGVSLSSSERWIILPFQNYSQTPRAGEQAEEILATLLRIQGLPNIEMYQQQDDEKSEWPELNDRKYQKNTLELASKENISYAVTGSIDEWQYKLGVGSEPAVGLTIRIIEVPSGKVVWSASGARSGWSTESLTGTAQKLLKNLISDLNITKI